MQSSNNTHEIPIRFLPSRTRECLARLFDNSSTEADGNRLLTLVQQLLPNRYLGRNVNVDQFLTWFELVRNGTVQQLIRAVEQLDFPEAVQELHRALPEMQNQYQASIMQNHPVGDASSSSTQPGTTSSCMPYAPFGGADGGVSGLSSRRPPDGNSIQSWSGTHQNPVHPRSNSPSCPSHYAPNPYSLAPREARIFITFTDDNRRHEGRVHRLNDDLRKNQFRVSLDVPQEYFRSRDEGKNYVKTRFNKCNVLLVCVSEKYFDETSYNREDTGDRFHAKYILDLYGRVSFPAKQLIFVLLKDCHPWHIPHIYSTPNSLTYRWPEDYADLLFRLSMSVQRSRMG